MERVLSSACALSEDTCIHPIQDASMRVRSCSHVRRKDLRVVLVCVQGNTAYDSASPMFANLPVSMNSESTREEERTVWLAIELKQKVLQRAVVRERRQEHSTVR